MRPVSELAAPQGFALRRLHPLTPVLKAWRWLAVIGIYGTQRFDGGLDAVRGREGMINAAVALAVFALGSVYGYFSWRATRFGVDGGDVRIESGVLMRQSRRVRLDRLQAVEVRRPILARLLGLAELRLEVVGASRAEGSLAYLTEPEALRLRSELLARAAGVHTEAPESAPEAPETVLHTVPFGRLVGSVLLRVPVLVGLVLAVGLIGFAAVTGHWQVLFVQGPLIFGLGQGVVSTVLTEGGFTIARSPDGLRIRRGLTETRAQTVPPGRVQAVRLVEPLLWRLRGWARLEVTVAGYAKGATSESTALLPVAPRADAYDLMRSVIAGAIGNEDHPGPQTLPLVPVPRRARWVDPVGWRRLAVGSDAWVFVSRRGVLRRELDVMPHAKVQSVRLSQGVLQRRLGLASVHLDVTPGPVSMRAEHRSVAEARELLDREAVLARAGRAADIGDRWMSPEPTVPEPTVPEPTMPPRVG